MEDLFARIVLGHLVGDYLLQNKTMALKKSENSLRGILWCTLHCLIYTASVCAFLQNINIVMIFLIFTSSWIIDHWSLASRWLKLIRGRDIMDFYLHKDDIGLTFSCLVYAVIDNTLHVLLIWLSSQWIL